MFLHPIFFLDVVDKHSPIFSQFMTMINCYCWVITHFHVFTWVVCNFALRKTKITE
ncbi:unnamed protein product [Meloidogyne enterolobii]|uniref:Uncharacterized protein n=1 Tax=Meloidogyne enterolobii TaxID=390850 RepID=A0ACB0ZK05_MELEN